MIADLSAAVVIALLTGSFALSYAALLFAGTPPATQSAGLVMVLTTGTVLAVVGALLSSIRFSIVVADGTLIAVLAVAAAGIVGEMTDAPAPALAATLLAMIMAASVVTGAALYLLGRVHAGRVVRYVPLQVAAGILAASGWSLSVGGLSVALGGPLGLDALTTTAGLKLTSAVLLAVGLLAASARIKSAMTVPLGIIAAIVVHYVAFGIAGWSLDAQRAAGWLLGLPRTLSLSSPWWWGAPGLVHWRVISNHASGLLALLPLTALSLLLATTGLEAAIGRDIDVDRELKTNGIAAIASAALGGKRWR